MIFWRRRQRWLELLGVDRSTVAGWRTSGLSLLGLLSLGLYVSVLYLAEESQISAHHSSQDSSLNQPQCKLQFIYLYNSDYENVPSTHYSNIFNYFSFRKRMDKKFKGFLPSFWDVIKSISCLYILYLIFVFWKKCKQIIS